MWNYNNEDNPIIFTYLNLSSILILLDQCKIATFVILKNHFNMLSDKAIIEIIDEAIKKYKNHLNKELTMNMIDDEDISNILNNSLIKLIELSFIIISEIIKNIRSDTHIYLIINNDYPLVLF